MLEPSNLIPALHFAEGLPPAPRDHSKTDVFRDQVAYSAEHRRQLAAARAQGMEAVRQMERMLSPVDQAEPGSVIDLLLSYRAVKAWQSMIDLTARMHPELGQTLLVREQLAFALNRLGRRDAAEQVLLDLIARSGPSSETYAILGRVQKDRWEDAEQDGRAEAPALLRQAIDSYFKGFEADPRDAYPGINAVTLMEIADPPDPRGAFLKPAVREAIERKIAAGEPDYWDYATRLEIAVLENDEPAARAALAAALARVREPWEPETTLRNLELIGKARQNPHWAGEIREVLYHSTRN